MFVSFFPRPKLFFWSALAWAALTMAFWYGFASHVVESSTPGIVGVALFWSAPSLWFDFYFAACVALFAGFWMWFAPHPWALWSIIGSALILFTSYFQVQVSVAINSWYGPFYDLVQAALSKSAPDVPTIRQVIALASGQGKAGIKWIFRRILTGWQRPHAAFLKLPSSRGTTLGNGRSSRRGRF